MKSAPANSLSEDFGVYKISHIILYLLTPWLYCPLIRMASFMIDAPSSLLFSLCLHLYTFILYLTQFKSKI
jgi:hypothetical protein